jgi:hypothetical protein
MAAQPQQPPGAMQGMQQQGQQSSVPPEKVMAQVSEEIVQADMDFASEALTVIEEVDQFIRQTLMQQNPDMAMVKVQADGQQQALELQTQKQASDLEIKMLQEENRRTRTEFEQMLASRKQEHNELIEQLKLQQDKASESFAQQVELLKNTMDNEQKQTTELLKNRDDNRTQILIEQIKLAMAEITVQNAPQGDKEYMSSVKEITNTSS